MIKTFLKGAAMGIAEVIPGISGGTVALILGIYERLIRVINSFDFEMLRIVSQKKFREAWNKVEGNFLSVLLIGMLVSIYSFSALILFLLETYPTAFKSFLSALLFFSVFIDPLRPKPTKTLFIGLFLAFLICSLLYFLPPGNFAEVNLLYIFLSGFIAISALIVPGISGSFILLLMGSYSTILMAVRDLNYLILIIFLMGALTGLFTIARLIQFAFTKNKELFQSIFIGLIVFCIPLVWKDHSTAFNSSDQILPVFIGLFMGSIVIYAINRLRAN